MEPPDRQERFIRFGCGAFLGIVVASIAMLKTDAPGWVWLVVLGIIAGGCGFAAMRKGDEFWWSTLENPGPWWSRWW